MSIDGFSMNDVKMLANSLERDENKGIKVRYDFNAKYNIYKDLQIIQMSMTISTYGSDRNQASNEKKNVDNKKTINICHLKTVFDFQVNNYSELIATDGSLVIPQETNEMLISIAYSTTRGVLFTKMRGTPLGNLVTPLLKLDQIPQEDIIIKSESAI
jgi:hypothetical protein